MLLQSHEENQAFLTVQLTQDQTEIYECYQTCLLLKDGSVVQAKSGAQQVHYVFEATSDEKDLFVCKVHEEKKQQIYQDLLGQSDKRTCWRQSKNLLDEF